MAITYKFSDLCYIRENKIALQAYRERKRIMAGAKRRNLDDPSPDERIIRPYPVVDDPDDDLNGPYRPPVAYVTVGDCHPPPPGYYLYPCITVKGLANFLGIDRAQLEKIRRSDPKRYPVIEARGKTVRMGRVMGIDTVHRLLADLHELTGAPIDRVSLLLWMTGTEAMDSHSKRANRDAKPFYDNKIENEIKRIAKLDDPARTIQAQELLERYRDVEAIVKGMKSTEAKSMGRERAKSGYDESRRVQFRQALEAIVERTGRKPKHI